MALVIADKIMQAWADAGIVDDIHTIRRFVVDFKCGEIPVIYIERIGDDRLLSVATTLEGIEIRRDPDLSGKQPEDPPADKSWLEWEPGT